MNLSNQSEELASVGGPWSLACPKPHTWKLRDKFIAPVALALEFLRAVIARVWAVWRPLLKRVSQIHTLQEKISHSQFSILIFTLLQSEAFSCSSRKSTDWLICGLWI